MPSTRPAAVQPFHGGVAGELAACWLSYLLPSDRPDDQLRVVVTTDGIDTEQLARRFTADHDRRTRLALQLRRHAELLTTTTLDQDLAYRARRTADRLRGPSAPTVPVHLGLASSSWARTRRTVNAHIHLDTLLTGVGRELGWSEARDATARDRDRLIATVTSRVTGPAGQLLADVLTDGLRIADDGTRQVAVDLDRQTLAAFHQRLADGDAHLTRQVELDGGQQFTAAVSQVIDRTASAWRHGRARTRLPRRACRQLRATWPAAPETPVPAS